MLDHRLELFIKVAEAGNITTVANGLYVSQPAISKQLKSLEKELNVRLFHRDKRIGLILTDVGKEILLLAKQQADLDNRIYQAAFKANNFIGGKLRIASLPVLSTSLLSRAFPIYRKLYPEVSIEVYEGTPHEVWKMVTEHSVDIGISCSPFDGLDYDVLIHDRLVGLFPYDIENIPKEIDLRKGIENLILCHAGFETVMEELSEMRSIGLGKALMFDHSDTVVSMVEHGNGVGILSKFTLDSIPNRLQICEVIPSFPIEIGVEAYNLNDLTPVAAEFNRILRDVAIVAHGS